MQRIILLSEMVLQWDNKATIILLGVFVGIPLGLALAFYLITRHVNRQFDQRPAVEQPSLDEDEPLVQ